MNRRIADIARDLSGSDVLTIDGLARAYGVSTRTIRNDLNAIDGALRRAGEPGVRLERGGVVVCLGNAAAVFSPEEADAVTRASYHLSHAERISAMASILAAQTATTTINALAEALSVSRTTIINDLESARALIAAAGLELSSQASKGLTVTGPESARRQLLMGLLEPGASRAAFEVVARWAPVALAAEELVRDVVLERQAASGVYLTDDSLAKVVSYLRISMARMLMGAPAEPCEKPHGPLASLAAQIVDDTCRYCHVMPGDYEAAHLCRRLERLQYARRDALDDDAPVVQALARQFIERVSAELGIDLTDDFSFLESLSNHLASVLRPAAIAYPDTPLIREVMRDNAAVADAARACSSQIVAHVGRELTPLELGYIVLHVCAAIERKKSARVMLHVVVACNSGVGTSQLLLESLRRSFNFKVVGAMTSQEAEALGPADADLIISSVRLEAPAIEWVQVSPLLTDDDLVRITAKINVLRSSRSLETESDDGVPTAKGLLAHLAPVVYDVAPEVAPALMRAVGRVVRAYFREGTDTGLSLTPSAEELLTAAHIRLDVACETWQEAVRASAQVLLDGGYIEGRYVDAIIANIEENGPYVVLTPEFALPHEGIDKGVREVGFSLVRLVRPVEFGAEDLDPVRFVCCMATTDHRIHLRAFFNLLNMMRSADFREALAAARTSEEAADLIALWEQDLES